MSLVPPLSHHLNAAQGWVELGNPTEALFELEQIPPAFRHDPEVLETHWQALALQKRWVECIAQAEELIRLLPDQPMGWVHRAYALHELGDTRAAMEALLPAIEQFPEDWLIYYNLACYQCRLGNSDNAIFYLKSAFQLGDAAYIKSMAADDTDLLEIRERIGKIAASAKK